MSDSYQTIRELIAAVSKAADKMEKGELDHDDFDVLVSQAREVYERLVVVRFKLLSDAPPAAPKEEEPIEAAPIAFPVGSSPKKVETNQTSLIDAIEQLSTDDEGEAMEASAEEESSSVQDKTEENKPEMDSKKKKKPDFVFGIMPGDDPDPDPKPKLTLDAEPSVADKLEKGAIHDLKSAISLNQKFIFINELFDGDNDVYASLIVEINNESTRKGAERVLQGISGGWDLNSEPASQFLELVRRRFPE
jgi:hypothetical protein